MALSQQQAFENQIKTYVSKYAATNADIKKVYDLLVNSRHVNARGLMTWAVNYDAKNNWNFANAFKETWGKQ